MACSAPSIDTPLQSALRRLLTGDRLRLSLKFDPEEDALDARMQRIKAIRAAGLKVGHATASRDLADREQGEHGEKENQSRLLLDVKFT